MPAVYKGLGRAWRKLPSISLDYAVMEKSKKIALVPADCGWLDLGSWQAVEEIMKKDKNGNIFKGKIIQLDCKNTTVWAGKRTVAALGLKDIVIVDTKDALLVCDKKRVQDVKKLIA